MSQPRACRERVGPLCRGLRRDLAALGVAALVGAAALVGVGAAAVGCGGAQFDGTVYRGEGVAFRIPSPPGHWERVDHSHALAFRDERTSAMILFNARCGLDGDDIPLSALTNHLFMQFTDKQLETQEVVPFDEREAMHTRMVASLDGVPLRYDAWVLKKDGCVYDMLYFAEPARFEAGYGAFSSMVRQFATLDPEA